MRSGLIQIHFVVAALMHKAGTEEPAWKAVPGLPGQSPTRFDSFVNLNTARALGLDVLPMLLALADETIEQVSQPMATAIS